MVHGVLVVARVSVCECGGSIRMQEWVQGARKGGGEKVVQDHYVTVEQHGPCYMGVYSAWLTTVYPVRSRVCVCVCVWCGGGDGGRGGKGLV